MDIKSLEYYDADSIPTVVAVEQSFIDKLKVVTEDINYANLPEFFTVKAHFEDYITENKHNPTIRLPRQPTGEPSIKEQLLQVFDAEQRKPLNEALLSTLKQSKKGRIESQWRDKLPVKIFLPEQWTLEYEIASSKLYKYLYQAIELAKIEKSNPYFNADDNHFSIIKDETDRRYSEAILTDKQQIFNIFQPISDNIVSKATVAQYLAQILTREMHAGVDIKSLICSDTYLQYIVNAIYHVTEPIIQNP